MKKIVFAPLIAALLLVGPISTSHHFEKVKADEEVIYFTDFEGIVVNATNPPDGPTGFVWAQEYQDARTEIHNGSNMLRVTAANKENNFSSFGGLGIGSKSNLGRLKHGEPYKVDMYVEFDNIDFLEVEFLGGQKWGAARVYKNGLVKNDNGGNDLVDVKYKNNHLSFKFTYTFNDTENMNGYITFKAYNSNGGFAYFDDISIAKSQYVIEGTFDEYPLGVFNGMSPDDLHTIIYTQTSDMTSTSEIISQSGDQKLKISYSNTGSELKQIFYFNKMQFMMPGREYTFSFDLATTDISELVFTYGGPWITPISSATLNVSTGSMTVAGEVFSSATYADSKVTFKFTVPNWSNDWAQILISAKATDGTTPTIIVDNTKMTVTPVLDSLLLDTTDVKKEFAFGEAFDSTGLLVKAVYSNGREEDVSLSECTFSGYEGNQTITVTYKTVSATYSVAVIRVPNNLIINTENVKTVYGLGEQLDLSNLVVTLTYADGGESIVLQRGAFKGGYAVYCGQYNPYFPGKYIITIVYKNLTKSFEVEVRFDATYSFNDIVFGEAGQ